MKRELAVLAVIGIALTGCSAQSVAPKTGENAASSSASKLEVAMLLAGSASDGGFMESGFNGLQRAHDQLGVEISYKEGVEPEKAALESALDELASSGVDMVIAHGGQNAEAAKTVAQRFPETMFVVTQANVTGPNLSSYEVLQEESAWLAGAAAGLLTETNVVGHMSGIRPIPGLKGRAAFVDGVAHTNPQATVLSNFSGDQDDIELSRKIAVAEIEEGADYIFTMLNAGRPGVTQAIQETGRARQFGNVRDFTQDDAKVFAGSAVADSGAAAFAAVKDLVGGTFQAGSSHHIGLENPDAVRLTLSEDIPQEVRAKINDLATKIAADEITVRTEYTGPEFDVK